MKLLDMIPEVSSEPLDKLVRNCEAVHILSTALDFDLFDVLEQPMSAEQVSMAIGTDASLTEKFLNALVALELLSKHDGTYTNTKLASTFLVKDSPFYQGNLLRLSMRGSSNLSMLTPALRGEVREGEERGLEKAFDSSFVLAMAEGAMKGSLHRTVREVSKLAEFQRARRLLDLGGGHGLYAIAFSQIKPDLEAVVFDLPHVVKVAEELIARHGMRERITTIGGNFLEDDIGNGYDMVFASDVFYRERDVLIDILKKIHDALREDGSVVLKHWVLDDERTAPLVSVFFDLKLSLHVNEHHVYTEREFVEMLEEAGFSPIRTLDISTPSSPSTIIVGRKEP